jgi:hypothetical protein
MKNGGVAFVAALLVSSLSASSPPVLAREAPTAESAPVPCALVESFTGESYILDSTRTNLVTVAKKAGVPCGGWITVKSGEISIKHRDGHRIHLDAGAFAQLPESRLDGVAKAATEQLVLFKGQAYVQVRGDAGPVNVLTANARVRVPRGEVIVIFSGEKADETQLISLNGTSTIENRFETHRKASVAQGEASSLNFKLLRVIPDTPRAVALAALRSRLSSLHVPAHEQELAINHARARQERIFAADLVTTPASAPSTPADESALHPESGAATRKPASDYSAPDPAAREAQAKKLRARMASRTVAGIPGADSLLYPAVHAQAGHGRKKSSQVKVTVKSAGAGQGQASEGGADTAEKQRLIDELSRIREE